MNIQAVVFDLDGTLLNTIDDIAESVNAALASVGLPPYTVEDYKYFVGDGVVVLIERALAPYPNKKHLQGPVLDRYLVELAHRQTGKTKPYDGIPELLAELTHRGIATAVLSNKPHGATVDVIGHYFPNHRFAAVMGKKPEFKPKPDPASLTYVLERLHCPRETVLYVGDTATDMQTAKNGGLRAIGCTWGFRLRDELEGAGSDHIVDRPDEILTWIETLKHDETIL
jgi:phosphoglycolate phosphatase